MTPITLDVRDAQVHTRSHADSPSLSAREIHEVIHGVAGAEYRQAHADNSLARRRFIEALRALHESRALLDLPQIASAFEHAVVDAGFAK